MWKSILTDKINWNAPALREVGAAAAAGLPAVHWCGCCCGRWAACCGLVPQQFRLPLYRAGMCLLPAPACSLSIGTSRTTTLLPVPQVSAPARDLLKAMLDRNPAKRIRAADALRHPWLQARWCWRCGV